MTPIFSTLYDKAITWSKHRHAPWYLAGLSFSESSFFPVPPDVMLAPMALARRERAWHLAGLTTVASVLGGVFGYVIGMFAFNLVEPLLHDFGYWPRYLQVQEWFNQWGIWIVFIAGFSPIPYKLFTISAGAMSMVFLPFVLASAIGRGARFFLVAGVIRWGGDGMERFLRQYIERIGWITVVIAVLAYFVLID